MKHRFQTKSSLNHKYGKQMILSVCVFAMIIALFFVGTNRFAGETKERQREYLEQALTRSIVFCYTVEGVYPENLDYLKEHYGLRYDEDLFFVDYRLIGANLMPDVTVIDKEELQ